MAKQQEQERRRFRAPGKKSTIGIGARVSDKTAAKLVKQGKWEPANDAARKAVGQEPARKPAAKKAATPSGTDGE